MKKKKKNVDIQHNKIYSIFQRYKIR